MTKKYTYMHMNEQNIVSPCISVCKTDPISGYCYGCGRYSDDKKAWKDENTTNQWKEENLNTILTRMKGWQLDTFKESYEHKKNKGISLFKKNLSENKN